MTEQKRNPNPFIRMAQEAKNKNIDDHEFLHNSKNLTNVKVPKPTKGFGNKIVKKTGRA